ncbi:MAG: hypothetical protein ACYCPX_10465 [Acidiferrobacteraceae bacterium]
MMDYASASKQLAEVQQQAQGIIQGTQALAQKLSAAAPDPTTAREWATDLKEIALSVQSQNQNTTLLLNQMADYIKDLEQQLATHPNPGIQSRGWSNSIGGGSFLGSVTSGLGLGAGLAVGEDLIGGLFNMF